MSPNQLLRSFALLSLLAVIAQPTQAQDAFAPGPVSLPSSLSAVTLIDVEIVTRGTTGDKELDATIMREARQFAAFGPGDRYNQILADNSALRMRRISGVRNATYSLQQRVNPDGITLVFHLNLGRGQPSQDTKGILNGGLATDIPVLFQNERSFLTLTLNGGSGVFRDGQAWFGAPGVFTRGNPLVAHPALGAQTGAVSAWTENYVEYGLGGAAQLGDTPFYAYGAASMIAIMSAGQDIFRSNTRTSNNLEKLYAGILYAGPTGTNGTLSVGRQNFSLNDGFLVSQFGSQYNAGPRPGIYLAPRTTQDFSILGQFNWQGFTAKGFWLDPNEYEPIESRTQLVGANLRYTWTPSIFADVTLMGIPQSNGTYTLPNGTRQNRAGLITTAAHARWADPKILDGLWIEGEAAHQSHRDFPMDAWAGYGTIGYLARAFPWTPSISYRYAAFSGDNPGTATYERFDPLFSGGLGEWLQGVSFGKVLAQSNKLSQRVRLNLVPVNSLNLTFDWYKHEADTLNNRGGNPAISQLSSRDLGQEFQVVARWSITKNFFFLGVAAYALPGEALKEAAGQPLKPWTTLQAQLFWTL